MYCNERKWRNGRRACFRRMCPLGREGSNPFFRILPSHLAGLLVCRLERNIMQYLITFFISMVPLVEIRGAVVYALAMQIPLWQALLISVIGNMIPVPFIFFFARRILVWGAKKPVIGKFFTWCLLKGHRGGQKLEETAGQRGIFWSLLIFVGIPLPGTGAWTGTLAASILDWDFKRSVFAVMIGVALAGSIMALLTSIGLNLF